jgi:hypothetical protein
LQETNVSVSFGAYLDYFIKKLTEEIEKAVADSDSKQISEAEGQAIFTAFLDKFHKSLENEQILSHFDIVFVENLKRLYTPVFLKVIDQKFSAYPLTMEDREKLVDIGVHLFTIPIFPEGISGVVIAGFGQKDLFPSLRAFDVECIVANRVKFKQTSNVDIGLETGSTAAIVPFAQQEMVDTFIGGIDPSLAGLYTIYLQKIFEDYPKIVGELVTLELEGEKLPKDFKASLVTKLAGASQKLFQDLQQQIMNFRQQNLIDPIVNMAAYLPKDELAAMAEALVNLTSFKRRISTSDETVGGPIDVAVISKGDGFIWVKRKHYF